MTIAPALERTGGTPVTVPGESPAPARGAYRGPKGTGVPRTRAALQELALEVVRSRATAEHARGPRDWKDRLAIVVACSRGMWQDAEKALQRLRGRPSARLEQDLATAIDGVAAQRRRWTELDAVAAALVSCGDLAEISRSRPLEVSDEQTTWVTERRPVSVSYAGCTLLLPGSRWQVPERRTDPTATGANLQLCGRAWFLTQLDTGDLVEQPYRCGSRLCPDCVARSAYQDRTDETGALVELATSGASIVMFTGTGKTVEGRGRVVLDDRDRRRWPELEKLHRVAEPGQVGTATGGAPLSMMLERARSTLRAFKDSTARDVVEVRDAVIGGFVSWEATARASNGEGRAVGRLRWHPHCHGVAALRPEVDPEAWAEAWKAVWCRLYMRTRRRFCAAIGRRTRRKVNRPEHAPFAAVSGQDVSIVHRSGDTVEISEVRRAVAQVVKYAGALDTMTGACAVEFAAATKGLHLTGQPDGAMHSATLLGSCARYAAACELERAGLPWVASDLQTLDELRAPLKRYDVPDEEGARAVLQAELGPSISEGLIRAWRVLLGDDPDLEDDERPPPAPRAVARIVAWDRGRWAPVTRARLAVWIRLGRSLLIGSADLASAFTGRIREVRDLRTIRASDLEAMIGRTAIEPPERR